MNMDMPKEVTCSLAQRRLLRWEELWWRWEELWPWRDDDEE